MANLCSHRKCWKAWLNRNLAELPALYLQHCYRLWNRNRGGVHWMHAREESKLLFVDVNSQEHLQRYFTTYSLGCLGAEEDQVFVRRYRMSQLPYIDPLTSGYMCLHEEGVEAYEMTSGEEEYYDEEDVDEEMN